MINRRHFASSAAALAAAVPSILSAAGSLALAGAAHAQAGGKKLKVAGIYSVPYEQQWISRVHQALKAAEARGDIEYQSTESIANADYERVVREYAMRGQDLIVGEAFPVEAAMRKVARDFPKTAFLMGSSGKPVQPNFSTFDNYIQEPAYLTGMIAGGMTQSNKIGMVGGYPIPEVNRLMNAFMAGAREVNPQVAFSISFINSWFDPPKAKEATFAMIDAGADVMYAERFGVADAAKERGKLVIGNVINTQPQYPDNVVASALWHFEPSIDHAIAQLKAGTFKGEEYGIYSHMKHGGASLAPLGTFESKVPADLKARVAARQADIQSGKFTVRIDDAAPKAK
ncbi:MAG: BMP family protein [Comamonas sp.]